MNREVTKEEPEGMFMDVEINQERVGHDAKRERVSYVEWC